jgi:hypothetical protein
VIEAGNRFQTVTEATVELWATKYKYDDARQSAIRHQNLPGSLVETTLSDAHGVFAFNTLRRTNDVQSGSYEIRVQIRAGREAWHVPKLEQVPGRSGWDIFRSWRTMVDTAIFLGAGASKAEGAPAARGIIRAERWIASWPPSFWEFASWM